MPDRLLLPGLRFDGHHGASAAEQAAGGPIVVDLEVEASLARSARTDQLTDTVDYRQLHEAVRRVVEDQRFNLLEALAAAIAERVLQLEQVERVHLRVAKAPRLPGQTLGFAVAITRTQADLPAR
ncbi:MAG TPA: dihydroneopterin aldolase [Candidatus Micrarchaeia archaeon]|nr:dihydroneopterin aldolase [Candidatus Micrarchaeia archaeon]